MRRLDAATLAVCSVGVLLLCYNRLSNRDAVAAVAQGAGSPPSPFEELCDRYAFVGEGLIRQIYGECAALDSSEIERELELVHDYYHQLREEVAGNPSPPGAVVLNTWDVGSAIGRSPDLDDPAHEELVADLWPAYLDRSVFDGVLVTRVVPLPYVEYQGFWDTKLRMDLLRLQLDQHTR